MHFSFLFSLVVLLSSLCPCVVFSGEPVLSVYICKESQSHVLDDALLCSGRTYSEQELKADFGFLPGIYGHTSVSEFGVWEESYTRLGPKEYYALGTRLDARGNTNSVLLRLAFRTNDPRFFPETVVGGSGLGFRVGEHFTLFPLVDAGRGKRSFLLVRVRFYGKGKSLGVTKGDMGSERVRQRLNDVREELGPTAGNNH